MSPDPELTHTSYLLLGFLEGHPHSGYDIKQIADHSTRFFWQISYGQIYPELKRLAKMGLAEQEPGSRGGRTRHLYRITDAGRDALRAWLAHSGHPSGFEMRDELLLKLFFSDTAEPAAKRAILDQMRLREEATLAEFRAIEPHARTSAGGDGGAKLDVLMGGIKLHETYLAHVKELLADIS